MSNKFLLKSSLVIILINLAIYAKTADYDFVSFDDHEYVYENPMITEVSGGNIKDIFTKSYSANYQPIVHLTYMAEHSFFKLNPRTYHITNTLLHIINSILVLFLIFMLTNNGWTAAIIALLFSLHPLQVETVSWVSERKGLLCAFFYFLSFIAYIRSEREGKRSIYVISIVLFLLALLSKPVAVTFPIILLLFDYYEEKLNKEKVIDKIPYFLFSLIFSIVTYYAQKDVSVTVDNRFLFAFGNIAFYIGKIILPIKLSAHYEYPNVIDYLSKDAFISIAMIVLLIVYALNFKKIKRGINFGIMFFLVSIIPVLRFIPVGLSFAADRYMYIPMIGFFFALTVLAGSFSIKSPAVKKVMTAVLIAYFILLGNLSYKRGEVWRSSYALWYNILQRYPDSPFARLHYNQTINNIAKIYLDGKGYMQARVYYYRILKYYDKMPKYNATYEQIKKKAYPYNKEQTTEVKKAMVDFFHIKLKEEVLYNMGMSFFYENNLTEARKYFTLLIRQFDKNADGYMQLGSLSGMEGKFDEAKGYFLKGLSLSPNSAVIHFNYARLLEENGNVVEAIEHFKKAEELNVDWDAPKKALKRIKKE